MPFDKGREIERKLRLPHPDDPKRPHPGRSHVVVWSGGVRTVVEVKHVSRETLNDRPRTHLRLIAKLRHDRRARRKERMQLRKRRGWR